MKTRAVQVEVVFQEYWNDGFGARGWKLASAISDPRVVASTAHVGLISPTCVLVHDIMDHYLCGLQIGGHRSEVVATMLHAMRNDLPVRKSINMMVDELCAVAYCGETLAEYIPEDMLGSMPSNTPSEQMSAVLTAGLERNRMRERLVDHYYALGLAGLTAALVHYEGLGLSLAKRYEVGIRLQKLFENAESHILRRDCDRTSGVLEVADNKCGLLLREIDWHCTI